MKTKREWLASAVILLGSGSILSAAALATTPSPEKSAAPVATATLAAANAEAANVTTDEVQAAADESTVQVVTGDLEKNELYIFADNEKIPEKVLDEHPDATIAILGADEKKASKKIESFTKTAKVVAERREKARIVEAVKAEADYQKLREWNNGQVTLSFDKTAAHDKSALPIQEHLYPRYTQLANLPAINLSDKDAAAVRKEMQRSIETTEMQNNDAPALSLSDLEKMANEKIVLPAYRGVHQRLAQIADLFKRKITPDAVVEKTSNAMQGRQATEVSAMNAKLALPLHTLHRYSFRLPAYLQMNAALPVVEKVIVAAPVMPASAPKTVAVKTSTPTPLAVWPTRTMRRFVFRLPEHLNVKVQDIQIQLASIKNESALPKVALHPPVNAKAAAVVASVMAAKAAQVAPSVNTKPAIETMNAGLLAAATMAVNFDKPIEAKPVAAPTQTIKVAEVTPIKVAPVVKPIKNFRSAKVVAMTPVVKPAAAPEQRIKFAERMPPVVNKAKIANTIAAIKLASAAKSSMPTHHANIALAAPVKAKAVKTVKAEVAVSEKYKAMTKPHHVALNAPTKPRQHINVAAREHALASLERELAKEQEPVFHPRRVATRRIESQRDEQQDNAVNNEREVYRHRMASAAPDVEEPSRPVRHHTVRPTDYDVASLDDDAASRARAKRYRQWNNPAEFSKLMMD